MPDVAPYDLSPFLDVPAELCTWRQADSRPAPAPGTKTLSCSRSGQLFASAGTSLLRLDDAGAVAASISLPEAASAISACCDKVAVALSRRVQVYDANLQLLDDGPDLGEKAHLVSIALQRDQIAASDFGQRRVWLLTGQGNPRQQLRGICDDSPTGFRLPSPYFPCAFGPEGDLWLGHTGMRRVERWQGTERIAHFGEAGMSVDRFCGCCNPVALALLPGGDVLTVEKGLPRIKRYRQDGTLVAVIAPPRSFDLGTQGIALAVHPNGHVWALDPKRQQLIRYEEEQA